MITPQISPVLPAVDVTDTGIRLEPDRTRVVTRLFVPGREDVGPGDSRAAPVIERIMALAEDDVEAAMRDLDDRFSDRHEDIHETFSEHAGLVISRIDPSVDMSEARRLLLGASFTHEYSIEGAALCNPSIVLHPRQDGSDRTAFILSLRGVGEGHRSSIGFRTGTVTAAGSVSMDPPGQRPRTTNGSPGRHHRSVFHAQLAVLDDDRENAAYVLDQLPPHFFDHDLDARIDELAADEVTRRNTTSTIANLRDLAQSSYTVEFDESIALPDRVLWPHCPAESHGMEDARFVRFVEESGDITYYATYTAFNGTNIVQHLLETTDFTTFEMTPIAGDAATGKGLALFPRKVHGQYVALSRYDRESNSVAYSDDVRCWTSAHSIQAPERPWEILQLGNCGSPIETDAGWLVLTHGVGPMRTYCLGALLLDLDEPHRLIARSHEPIISPGRDQREGYVPNVVYTCGALALGDVLVLPYGVGDQTISIVTMSIDQLLGTLRPEA
jgi:predicted GH43/DUF377 family glycosyl hydrolase